MRSFIDKVKDVNPLWKAKKKYACYALLQKTKGYISYETIFFPLLYSYFKQCCYLLALQKVKF